MITDRKPALDIYRIVGRVMLVLVSVFTMLPAIAGTDSEGWRLGADRDGIKVYTRKTDQCKMRTSRAEMFLPISVDQVIALLNDFNGYAGWFPSCKEAKILRRISDTEFMAILTYKTPWPLPNLDCVERMVIRRNRTGDTSYIDVRADPTYVPMVKDVSRVKQMQATWRLVAVNGGTYLVNEYFTDMGGLVPAWIGNTQAVEIPFNIFTGMRQRVSDVYRKR